MAPTPEAAGSVQGGCQPAGLWPRPINATAGHIGGMSGARAVVIPARPVMEGTGSNAARHGTGHNQRGADLGQRGGAAGAGGELGDPSRDRRVRRPGLRQPRDEARGRERGGRGAQRGARAVQKLPHRAAGHPERSGDLLVRASLELTQHHRVALALGQALHGEDQLANTLFLLHGLRRLHHAVEVLRDLVVRPAVLAQEIQ